MKGVIFLVLWFTFAALHTFFDLKVRPYIREKKDEWGQQID